MDRRVKQVFQIDVAITSRGACDRRPALTISAPSCDGSTWTRNGRSPNGRFDNADDLACNFRGIGVGGLEAGKTLQRFFRNAGIRTGFIFGDPRLIRRLAGMSEMVGALGKCARTMMSSRCPQRKLGGVGHGQRIHAALAAK